MRKGTKAQRLRSHLAIGFLLCLRETSLALTAILANILATPVSATPPDVIVKAEFSEPTQRYGHAVLGPNAEWGALVLTVDPCLDCGDGRPYEVTIRLPESRVFEDLAPRIVQGDETPTLVMVVESSQTEGARLALYDEQGLYAATPFIGRRYRWLAPISAQDLNGDGWPEFAYIDRPHLAKTLRIWTLKEGELRQVASKAGLTNHKIGQDFITSGLRDCGNGPEIITVNADWSKVMSSKLTESGIVTQELRPLDPDVGLGPVLACEGS